MSIRSASRSVALLAALLLAAPCALADGTADARSHFTRGVELFKEGDFRAALIEFQRAYDAAPNYKVLYNLGQTSFELQDYAGALKAFRGYLDGGGSQIPPARVAQVEADLKKLEARVARVEVAVNVEGADVAIDDVSVGRSPLREAVLVGAGRRRIVVSKAGLQPVTRMIDVAGGDKPRVTIELMEPKAAPPQVIIEQQPTPQPEPVAPPAMRTVTGPSTAFYIGLVVTSTLVVGTAAFGVGALAAKSDFDSKIAELGVTPNQVSDARSTTTTLANITDVVGAVAIASAITTVVLAFTTSSKHQVREKVSIELGPTGMGIRGAF